MSELYSGTESAVRCSDAIYDLFPVVTGVRQGCALAPTLFSTFMDWILGRMLERSSCAASFGNVKISDLDFADDSVIFAEMKVNLRLSKWTSLWLLLENHLIAV